MKAHLFLFKLTKTALNQSESTKLGCDERIDEP